MSCSSATPAMAARCAMRACAAACRTGYATGAAQRQSLERRARSPRWLACAGGRGRCQRCGGHYLQRVTRWRQPAQVVLGAREPLTIFQQQDTALPAEARIQLLDFRMDLAEGIRPRSTVRAWRRVSRPVRRCWTWRWCAGVAPAAAPEVPRWGTQADPRTCWRAICRNRWCIAPSAASARRWRAGWRGRCVTGRRHCWTRSCCATGLLRCDARARHLGGVPARRAQVAHALVERVDVPCVAPALAWWPRALRLLRGLFCVAQGGGPCVRMSSGAGRWPSPPLYFVRKGLRPAFGVRRRFLERRLRVLRSPHRTPSLVGALQPQRRRLKTRVWRMHSARRRTDALAYECPPAPAVGRHLPFTSYARASARRSEFVGASLKGGRACCALLTACRASSGRAGVWAK